MALSLSTIYKGVEIAAAYHRVVALALHKTTMTFGVSLSVAFDQSELSRREYLCAYDIDGPNPYVQAYQYLKSLTDYAGAVDC